MRTIWIDISLLDDKRSMSGYMKQIFDLPEYFGGNLDALNDCMSEISEDTQIRLKREDLIKAAENAYAWKTIRVIINAASENPRLDFTIE